VRFLENVDLRLPHRNGETKWQAAPAGESDHRRAPDHDQKEILAMATEDGNGKDSPVCKTVDGTSENEARKALSANAWFIAVQNIRTRLAEHVGELRFVNGALMTCVQALLQQNAELDADIALVLRRTVSDKLDETTDHLEAIALGVEPGELAA
jgi:hypothetical protein